MLEVLRRSGRTPRIVVLRMESVPYIDSSGARALEVFLRQAAGNGTRVMLCELRAQPAEFLDKAWAGFAGAERVASFAQALSRVAPAAGGD
jgi:sulfate permease, SulP family